jgi:predicted RNase H-like nuclease (RuvC/YqgF family)
MAAPSPTHPSLVVPLTLSILCALLTLPQKTRGHHAPYTGTEESRYRTKCKDLKRKITDVEAENDNLTVKIDRAKRSITRMRLERALLLEKLEERTPVHVDDSDGSESEVSSVPLLKTQLIAVG